MRIRVIMGNEAAAAAVDNTELITSFIKGRGTISVILCYIVKALIKNFKV